MSSENLTVPQLKALCKERKLKGYSKLGRAALIQLLSAVGHGHLPITSSGLPSLPNETLATKTSSDPPNLVHLNSLGSSSATIAVRNNTKHANADPSDVAPTPISPSQPLQVAAANPGVNLDTVSHMAPSSNAGREAEIRYTDLSMGPPPTVLPEARCNDAKTAASFHKKPTSSAAKAVAKRSLLNAPLPSSKKLKVSTAGSDVGPSSVLLVPSALLPSASTTLVTANASDLASGVVPTPAPLGINRSIPNTVNAATLQGAAKRFKPLVLSKPLGKSKTPMALTLSRIQKDTSSPRKSRSSQPLKPVTLQCLDFTSSFSVPTLQNITLPPSLAQRRRVQCWAIILTVYLSACHILEKRYAGQRLNQVLQQYSLTMTDMWPYLRLRDTEAEERQNVFCSSFLGKLAEKFGAEPIAGRLWGSPDHRKQVTIAARFVLTRYWFILSIGGRPDQLSSWLEEKVVDVQEVIPNEIWSIAVKRTDSQTQTFYVLDSTCEVVGRVNPPILLADDGAASKSSPSLPMRADWSAYIQQSKHLLRSAQSSDAGRISLLDRLKWDGYEEYDHGMSRLWLKRLDEVEEDETKRVVAKRYIFACVVGNSISGAWRSTSEMAQEFAGLSAKTEPVKGKGKEPTLNLYLPTHHHIESVHFRTPSGEPLHSAVASIQTPHREYFVLKDNGMEIGNEEIGVYEAWMEVLACDNKGLPVA
ncbi:hypothetical protein EIP91_009095 [Steccherinum ochraceum]|uniref:Rho termination factor N-terminal domain-containing protein n=1 Tax=Steccherinum ochraceum TaxID=92696 RepID=A0A4R0RPD0_9APHY|nr:hypothetical protein EIP91_009095 [Steccherinum ochraceum]